MAACSRKTLKNYKEMFAFFWKKRPITVKFSNFCSESFHRDTDRRVVFKFRKFGQREIGKIVHCLPDNKNSRGSPAVAAALIAPKICRCQPPTTYSKFSIFHPNRSTFGGVIAKRQNAP